MKKSIKYIALFSVLISVFVGSLIALNTKDVSNTEMLMIFLKYTGMWFAALFTVSALVSLLVIKDDQPVVQNQTDVKDGDIFYFYGDYHYGYSRVEELHVISAAEKQVKSRFAFADETGEIVTKWFDGATEFEKPGVAVVYDDGRYNFLDKECNLILPNWPKNIGEQINDNKLKVFWDDGTINFVDFKKKALLWKDWKKSVG